VAVKSIVDIDLNDAAFQRYAANFKKYSDLLAKTPDAWKKVSSEINASKKSFQDLVAASVARQGYAKLTAEAERAADRILQSQSRSWRDMARSTKDVAGNIAGATRQLLRWAGLTSVISGLLGAGGLYGIDRLAISAASQRRSSSGLGVTPGQEKAFGLNYGRLVDPDSVLHGVNAALTDASQRGNLYRAGLSESDISGRDAAQVSVALIGKLKTLADRTPTQLLGTIVQAYGLGSLGIGAEDLQRLKGRSAAEIAKYGADYARDSRSLNLSPGQQSAWESLKVQLQRAGEQIEQTFIKNLTPLTPSIERLSAAFSHLVDRLLGGEAGKSLVDTLAGGLTILADTLGSKKFQDDLVTFADDIGKIAHGIHVALGWLFRDKSKGEPGGVPLAPPSMELNPSTPEDIERGKRYWRDIFKDLFSPNYSSFNYGPAAYLGGGVGGAAAAARVWQASFRNRDDDVGLISLYESGNRNIPNYRYDATHTAGGYYQITDTTWREIAPLVGAGQYPNAMSAPYDVQTRVAIELRKRRGLQPWSTNKPLMHRLLHGDNDHDTSTKPSYFSRPGPTATPDPKPPAPHYVPYMQSPSPMGPLWVPQLSNDRIASAGSGVKIEINNNTGGNVVVTTRALA
jgi:hypothetical protein